MVSLSTEQKEVAAMVSSINWTEYETAYGNADEDIPLYVPIGESRRYYPKAKDSLMNLFSDDEKTALQASHDLWCGLCHQHAYISSAALPAFDILFYGLQTLGDQLKVEILDIFFGFAICISNGSLSAWHGQLRAKLMDQNPCFQALAEHENEDISSFAEGILDELQSAQSLD